MENKRKTEPGSRSNDHMNMENMSIQDLVSVLRTAFLTEQFDSVEEILVSRYEKLRAENQHLQQKFQSEEELRKREEMCERGKKAQNNYEKLLKEVKKTTSGFRETISELEKKNSDLELEVSELRKRVGVLENEKNAFGVKNSELEKSMKKNCEAQVDAGITAFQEKEIVDAAPLQRIDPPMKRRKGDQGASLEESSLMENNGYDTPNMGCVHLLVHFGGERSTLLLKVDPGRYSYLDLVDGISGLAITDGLNNGGLSFAISFCHPTSKSTIPIKTDSHVLEMFKLYNMCSCIHVYTTLLNHEGDEVVSQVPDIILSEFDDDWRVSGEPPRNESDEILSGSSYIDEEKRDNEINIDEHSDYEEKHDRIASENSAEDKVSIYSNRGIKGKISAHEFEGKVKLEVGLLFSDVNEFRTALRDFVIQEGFEIKRIKNEKARVTARCAADGCCWRIHASPAPDGITYMIKSYNPGHSCTRTTKNSNATSTWIARKLESKLKADPNMSYAGMKQELLDSYGIEPSNVGQLYRARKKVRQDAKEFHPLSYNDLPSWANLALETNPGSVIKHRGSNGQIDPPVLSKLPDRPKVNRKRSVIEGPGGSQVARRSNTVRCGNCKEFGHNILGCQRDKSKIQEKLNVRRSSDGNAACSRQVTQSI